MRRHPILVIHGGTGAMPDAVRLRRIRRRLRDICARAHRALEAGAGAVEAAVLAVRLLEDDPLFNAGTGSVLQRDGRVRMSASVMDGARMRFAGVLNIERVRNPVEAAKALLEEEDRVLAGPEALVYARALGLGDWDPATSLRRKQLRGARINPGTADGLSQGTVGAVALDGKGGLAAATSTGGKSAARPGRVSDSGQPAGNYADDRIAVSCTGLGEQIVEDGLAVRLAEQARAGSALPQSLRATFRWLKSRDRRAGAIALDARGRVAWDTTLPVLLAAARDRRGFRESFR